MFIVELSCGLNQTHLGLSVSMSYAYTHHIHYTLYMPHISSDLTPCLVLLHSNSLRTLWLKHIKCHCQSSWRQKRQRYRTGSVAIRINDWMRSHLANSFLKKMEVLTYIHLPFPMFVEHALFLTFVRLPTPEFCIPALLLSKKNMRLHRSAALFGGRTQPSSFSDPADWRFHLPSHLKAVSDACRKLSGPHGQFRLGCSSREARQVAGHHCAKKRLVRGCQAILLAAVDAQIWGRHARRNI